MTGQATQTTSEALDELRGALEGARRAVLKPPPRLSVPDWADRYRRLSKSSGSIGGKWKTSRVEVARGPMMAVTEPGVKIITAMTCTQLLKTSLLENVFGYFSHLDPCPMMLMQPKDEAAEQFSRERLAPMVQATPALRKIIGDGKSRSSDDTLHYKKFPGGFLALAGAGSPTNFAMRAIRVLLLDEVDKYEANKEGDPIALAEERQATFPTNRISIRACSPTWEESSRIHRSYYEGDQRRAFVACPHCGHENDLDFFRHVHWQKTEDGEHRPDTAQVHCEGCGIAWTEAERLNLVGRVGTIRWYQTRPFHCCEEKQDPRETRRWRWDERNQVGRAICKRCGRDTVSNVHASFTASKLFSPFITVAELARKWVEAKDDIESRQTFYNTQLGLAFKAQTQKDIKADGLISRVEVYDSEVPDAVVVITAGIDVQPSGSANEGRLEVEVVGWGLGEESWSLAHEVFVGDPALPNVWADLDAYLLRRFKRADGREMAIRAVCIDSGGHNTQEVYNFARSRTGRNIWAIKGASDRGAQWSPIWPPAAKQKKHRAGYRPIMIGVNAGKEAIRQRLLIQEPGPGYCHFPAGRSADWFAQLASEKLVLEKQGRQIIRRWVKDKHTRNEGLDCRVYAYAALWGLYHVRRVSLERFAAMLGVRPAPPEPAEEPPHTTEQEQIEEPASPAPQPAGVLIPARRGRAVRRSSWMA
jgi:phage terminase large subunit GpA-like protein